MPKRDLQQRINDRPAVARGILTGATVVQVSQLAMTAPFSGDFQIIDQGRLIVGANIDFGPRVTVTDYGLFGYDTDGVNTFAAVTRPWTTYGAGDVFAGYVSGNYLLFDQSEGTLGLYSPAGAGFIADTDGSLYAGDTDGAHMHWSSIRRAFEVRNGEDIKISLDADGNGFFDGTVYAQAGRIYGAMQVDGLLRVGDVDGPSVSMGKFSRYNDDGDLEESGEIVATDASNMPWFRVVAGGGTTYGGHFHLGGSGDYPQRLTYDGADLVFDGTLYARDGEFTGSVSVTTGSISTDAVTISQEGIRIDANYGKFGENALEWWTSGTRYLSIGTNNLEVPIAAYIESTGILTITSPRVIIDGQLQIPVVAAASADDQTLYEDDSDNSLYYKNSLGTAYKIVGP